MKIVALIFLAILSTSLAAQSGRVAPDGSVSTLKAASTEPSVKELFDEANGYAKAKFAEYEEKKVRYNQTLKEQTIREQKQLAAKNAAIAGKRSILSPDDLYYLGLLHWMAENFDGTSEILTEYVATDDENVARKQTARSLIAVSLAKQRKFDESESILNEYLEAGPSKLNEQIRMRMELANGYKLTKNYDRVVVHANAALLDSTELLKEPSSLSTGVVDGLLDAGLSLFEAYKKLGNWKSADAALNSLLSAAKQVQSTTFYYYVIDKQIVYMIQTGRKTEALNYYGKVQNDVVLDLDLKSAQSEVLSRLKRRDVHYKLLGEPAPEFVGFDQWFPGKPMTLSEMKGKVILIDFWATWCGPCFEAFPLIKRWQGDYGKDGFEVLGVTRYYGRQIGAKDVPTELALLKTFKAKYELSYDFIVAEDQGIQIQYGAMTLPTAVIVDRKGKIRYIESGTNSTRLEEMGAMIEELIAEK